MDTCVEYKYFQVARMVGDVPPESDDLCRGTDCDDLCRGTGRVSDKLKGDVSQL
jgi:hypothetical protein